MFKFATRHYKAATSRDCIPSQSPTVCANVSDYPISVMCLQFRLLGRPGRRLQPWSGRRPRDKSTWHWSAWWAGVSSESLAMCPKTAFRRRVTRSNTGQRPVSSATSVFRIWSCQRIFIIWRWHFIWNASRRFAYSEYGPCLTGVKKNG